METTLDTRKTAGRRVLHFKSIDDILADVNHLAEAKEVKTVGNWTAGQILQHLAIAFRDSIDGYSFVLPGFVRFFLRLFVKKRFLTRPMSPGFKLPGRAASLLPPPTSLEDGLRNFREAVRRLKTETKRGANPVLGKLTNEEWDQLHCRHAELHLSFLVPVS